MALPMLCKVRKVDFMKRLTILLLVVLLLSCTLPALGETVAATDASTPTLTPTSTPTPTSSSTPEELLQQWYDIGNLLRANGNYPFVELRKGDVGYEVKALQTRLAELGFYNKEVVDNFGKGTFNAMKLFEKANKLTVDGVASVSDQKVLFNSTAIEYSGEKTSSSTTSNNSSKSDATSSATSNN